MPSTRSAPARRREGAARAWRACSCRTRCGRRLPTTLPAAMSRLSACEQAAPLGDSEGDAFKLDAATQRRQLRCGGRRQLGARVEDVAEAPSRRRSAGSLPELRHPHDRLRDALREHVEGDDCARQLLFDDEAAAVPQNDGAHHLADQADAFVAVARQRRSPKARPTRTPRADCQRRRGPARARSPDGLDAGDGLDEERLAPRRRARTSRSAAHAGPGRWPGSARRRAATSRGRSASTGRCRETSRR